MNRLPVHSALTCSLSWRPAVFVRRRVCGGLLARPWLLALLRTLLALPLLSGGAVRDLRLPQLGLVLVVRQLGGVHAVVGAGLSGGGSGQQLGFLGGEIRGVVPAVGALHLLLLILEEVFDLVGHVEEVLLGNLATLEAFTGLQREKTTVRGTL